MPGVGDDNLANCDTAFCEAGHSGGSHDICHVYTRLRDADPDHCDDDCGGD